jgi:nucleoid DNA-binding protein
MESPSADDVIDAFTEIVKQQLSAGNAVEVPALGTFDVEHRPSAVREEDDVRRLVPPRNEVVFTPDQDA